ncbi:MAG: hypothetical protein HGA45_24000 [Chloroflexales bacterium]|nr:hypothetical protein [Chloroflexales bacterium]
MLNVIADCQVLITGGMGAGMDQRLGAAGLRAIRTRMQDIDQPYSCFWPGGSATRSSWSISHRPYAPRLLYPDLCGNPDPDCLTPGDITASRSGVSSIPALYIFKQGQVVDRLMGAQPESVLRQALARHPGAQAARSNGWPGDRRGAARRPDARPAPCPAAPPPPCSRDGQGLSVPGATADPRPGPGPARRWPTVRLGQPAA